MLNYRAVFLGNLLFAAVFLLSCFLQAGIRQSGDQTIAITVESADSGGGRLTGGGFKIDSNIGGIAGEITSSGMVPAQFVVKNGYLGQLFDITGLAISGPTTPAEVDEEDEAQLGRFPGVR